MLLAGCSDKTANQNEQKIAQLETRLDQMDTTIQDLSSQVRSNVTRQSNITSLQIEQNDAVGHNMIGMHGHN